MGCYIIRTFVIKTLSDIAVYVVGNQVGIGLREIAYWRALGDDVSDKFNLAETRKPPIHVDFEFLLEQNDDIVAWIYSPDTPINYPVVQTADNEYYLRRLVDGSTNPYGTIFLDYRNASDFYDWNSIIYGHNMKNESMFGTLLLYKEQSYFEEHPELYLISPDRSYKIILIAGFETDAASNIYNSFNADNAQKTLLLEAWLNASDFDSKFVASENSRFITLSTCSYESDDARYVLVGVLESY